MARATGPKRDSTTQVVDILNKSGGSSTENTNKRTLPEQAARRSVGRPVKRSKIVKDPSPTADGAYITPATTAVEDGKDSAQATTTQRNTKLPNPRVSSSARSRASTTKMAQGLDVFTIPLSPGSASVATRSGIDRDDHQFSLEHSAFGAVPSSKQVVADLAKSPSQRTRSKLSTANASKHEASPSQPGGQVHHMRRLRSRPAVGDSVGDESLQAAAERKGVVRNSRKGSKLPLTSVNLTQEDVVITSENIGYPSPEIPLRSKDKRADKGRRLAVTPTQKQRTASKQARKPLVEAADPQNDNKEEADAPRRKGRFEKAAELHDCGEYWTKAWNAAKDIQDKSDPETRPVQELVGAMQEFKENIRKIAEDSLSELDDSELDKIAIAMGNLERHGSSLSGAHEDGLIRDIYLQAIPRAVDLLRSILIVRAANDKLSLSALEELRTILKATRQLCETVYHRKPILHLKDKVKSRTNLDIKPSLKSIEDEYKASISDLRAAEDNARAKIREEEFAKNHVRQKGEREQNKLARRQNRANCVQQGMADRQRQKSMRSRRHVRERSPLQQAEPEAYDVDDLELFDSAAQPTNRFVREATEDIPGPTKRVWQKEETLALLLLLQRYRDLDRYERIQEVISKYSRDIRKAGGEKILTMTDNDFLKLDLAGVDDVLDDLGNMEIDDINEHAQFLKAMQAREMERDVKATGNPKKWAFLSSV